MLKVPVLFIAFNNIKTAQQVFDVIKEQQPEQLFFAVDAPRDIAGEAAKCEAVKALIKEVNWPCQVSTFYPEKNLGAKLAVSKAITWFFQKVELGIILEHDCLPNSDFFIFCQSMLEKYRYDRRVMHISGDNFCLELDQQQASYFATRIPNIWGWATWRRAWQYYDLTLTTWPVFLSEGKIKKIIPNKLQQKMWLDVLNKSASGQEQSWDWQWTYAVFDQGGLCLNPTVNLVSNIGFSSNALNTNQANSSLNNLPASSLPQPFCSPEPLVANTAYDYRLTKIILGALSTYYGKKILKFWGLFNFFRKIKRHYCAIED